MNRPPDPGEGDPGGPPVGCYVTLSESGMDTDGNMSTDGGGKTASSGRKRARAHHKHCKSCNKKKAKYCKGDKRNDKDEFYCTCSVETITETSSPHSMASTSACPPPTPLTTVTTTPTPNTIVKDTGANSRPTPIGRVEYQPSDASPFIVHVTKESDNEAYTLHPITFGRFLKRSNFKSIINGSVKRIGRNRISLAFNNFTDANIFLNNSLLKTNNYKAYIPTSSITRMGIARGFPTEWSDEEIINNVNIPIGCGKILKLRRLNYKVNIDGTPTWKPSQSVVFTFDGQVLPKRIYICYNALPVELYIFPTIQCYSCCRFGHTKAQCRSKARCYKCGQAHDGASCNVESDNASCCLCSGLHYATSKNCPEYSRQTAIKRTMAESCVSYLEACKQHPPVHKSFVDVLNGKTVSHLSQTISSNKNNTNSHITSPSISYKKMLTLKPRSTKPYHTGGYDQVAHNQLIKDYNMPTPANGCALRPSNSQSTDSIPNAIDIITNLINSLTQSHLIKPDHAASIIMTITNTLHSNNGSDKQNNPMELPQHIK